MTGFLNALWIHCAVGSSSGSPARNSARRLDRSACCISCGSCFFSTRIAVGAVNIRLIRYFSTSRHQMPPSGRIGVPSYMTVVSPAISGA